MDKITVPDVPHPKSELCWRQGPTLARCDRKKGHGGPCVWDHEAWRKLLASEPVFRATREGE